MIVFLANYKNFVLAKRIGMINQRNVPKTQILLHTYAFENNWKLINKPCVPLVRDRSTLSAGLSVCRFLIYSLAHSLNNSCSLEKWFCYFQLLVSSLSFFEKRRQALMCVRYRMIRWKRRRREINKLLFTATVLFLISDLPYIHFDCMNISTHGNIERETHYTPWACNASMGKRTCFYYARLK